MDMTTALRDLGVTGDVLTQGEKDQLDRDGFLALEGILTPEEVSGLNKRMAELTAAEGDRAGLEVHQEKGTDRLADLVNKDPRFEVCFSHPRVLAAMRHVLGEFRLSSLNSRAALPGRRFTAAARDLGSVQPDEPAEHDGGR